MPEGHDLGQAWNPEGYARHARFVSDLGEPVIELLAPRAGERILDLGCGDGVLGAKLAALGCAVVAVDASHEQLVAARQRGLAACRMDGQALALGPSFDAVFSNAALHWMRQPDDAIDGVWRALKPGGRFVAELGGAGCVATIRAALVAALGQLGIDGSARDPWYFPTAEEYGRRLRARGFVIDELRLFPRPTPIPGDLADWLDTFAGSYLIRLSPAERRQVIDDTRERLRPRLCDAEGRWTADYIRLRFAATKPGGRRS